ncbi:MAG: 16S rRNA (guanine(966)-N(2))-methyltransferase RsmD [Actinomycetota bacterium]
MSGKFKGRKLKIPSSLDIRPTQDRVKESIFNVIGRDICGKKVLDLFAGSGSLGLESLSRGAQLVYFTDRSLKAVKLIRYNINSFHIGSNNYKIIREDAVRFLEKFTDIRWDIVFVDPPYRVAEGVMEKVFERLAEKRVTSSRTLIVYQYFFKKNIDLEIKKLNIVKESSFGDKKVTYLTP